MSKYVPKMRWFVKEVHINSQGYSKKTGYYWGVGDHQLWFCYSVDGKHEFYIRGTKEHAREAYKFARNAPDPDVVCFNIRTKGTWI